MSPFLKSLLRFTIVFSICLFQQLLVAIHYDLYSWEYVPLLTPLFNFLAIMLSPLTPLIGPFTILMAIRYAKHPQWRAQRKVLTSLILSPAIYYVPRFIILGVSAGQWWKGEELYFDDGWDGMWAYGEQEWWKLVVEAVLLVTLAVVEHCGWNWDNGVLKKRLDMNWQKFLENLEKEEGRDTQHDEKQELEFQETVCEKSEKVLIEV